MEKCLLVQKIRRYFSFLQFLPLSKMCYDKDNMLLDYICLQNTTAKQPFYLFKVAYI